MNWYWKIAGSRDEYLRSLGASEDIIAYINSTQYPQLLLNEFRKKPNATLEELQLFSPGQRKIDWSKEVNSLATKFPVPMIKWIVSRILRLKREPYADSYDEASQEYQNFFASFMWSVNQLGQKISQVKDWYNATLPDIASYSVDRAIQLSDEWHETVAAKGIGKIYEEKNIVYGPQWIDPDTGQENEKWRGWTIQKVSTENDLETEGNRMNHCVGSYYDQVKTGETIIYSLRDPKNEPHITMEAEINLRRPDDADHFMQIFGHSNSEPKDEYKNMIRYWVKSQENRPSYEETYDQWSNLSSYSGFGEMEKILETLSENGNEDEYGFETDDNISFWHVITDLINQDSKHNRDMSYNGALSVFPHLIVSAAIKLGPKAITDLEVSLDDISEKANEELDNNWYYEPYSENMPKIEDYEDEKMYDEAMEKFWEDEAEAEADVMDEYRRDHIPYGFLDDIYKELNKARKQGLINKHELV